jgi:hypothetical protein
MNEELDDEFDPNFADYLKLANLKALNGNIPSSSDRRIADMQNNDLSGTESIQNSFPSEPLQPGSFDVRANPKIEIGAIAGSDVKANSQIQPEIGPPPDQTTPASDDQGIWSKIKNFGSMLFPDSGNAPPQEIRSNPKNLSPTSDDFLRAKIAQSAQHAPQEISQNFPSMAQNQPPAIQAQNAVKEQLKEQMAQAPIGRPPEVVQQESKNAELGEVVPDAVQEVYTNPDLKQEVEKYLGAIPDEYYEKTREYEKAMKAYLDSNEEQLQNLSAQETEILNRIETKELSSEDKIMMALAIIAPAIIGGLVAGKAGAIAGLGGSLQQFGEINKNEKKEKLSTVEKLSKISEEKAKVQKERAETFAKKEDQMEKFRETIPDKDLREVVRKNAQVIDGIFSLNTGNSLLPIDASSITDIQDWKDKKKMLPELSKVISNVDKATEITDQMYDLLDIQNKINEHGPLGIGKVSFIDPATRLTKTLIPFARDTFKDENGNEIKLGAILETLRTQLKDVWRDSHDKNGNAFQATEQHFDKQLPDTLTTEAFGKGESDPNLFKKRLDLIMKNFESGPLSYIKHLGFNTKPLEDRFNSSKRKKTVIKEMEEKKLANEIADREIAKNKGK